MIIDSQKYNGLCSCGKEHKMETLFSIIESGCLKDVHTYMEKYGLKGYTVAVYDRNTYKATVDRHPSVDKEIILEPENLHANEHGVKLLSQELPTQTEVLIAVGSGTVHDITRYCAYEKGIDFVSCPTAASVDGFCSSVAAMTWNGCKKTLTAVAPKIVVADIDIIKNAPLRLAKSGFGDMVGKYIALTDWKIGNIINHEYYCERIANLTKEATETVLKSAEGIVDGNNKSYENLMYGLLLSGLAMQMIGNSRPASGAEHHISHIIEMEPDGLGVHSDALHGEKVGVGTLMAIREYHRLANIENVNFDNYTGFSLGVINSIFDSKMSKEIQSENAKDVAFGIKGETIKNNWQKIIDEIKQIPSAEYLESLYNQLEIKSKLTDIGVENELKDKLLEYSPMVRNRLTLMRLKKCIKWNVKILQTAKSEEK